MLSMRRLAAVSPLASIVLRRTATAAAVATQQQLRSFASTVSDEGNSNSNIDDKPTFGIWKEYSNSPPWHRRTDGEQEKRPAQPLESEPGPKQDLAEYLRGMIRGSSIDGVLHSFKIARFRNEITMYFKGLDQPVHVSTLWLRDACKCPACVTPSSGQKTFHTHDLHRFPYVEHCKIIVDEATGRTSLRVVWGPPPPRRTEAVEAVATSESTDSTESPKPSAEKHVSLYDSQELLYTLARYDPSRGYPGKLPRRLWDQPTIEKALKPVSYADWMATDDGNNAEFYRGLLDLHELGILIVDDVPDSETAVKEIANQIGNIQTTFYGELFDVVSKPQAENVAYTNVFLCLHQDLLYMNDPPYIQLLHCLRNDCDGGESLFSDSVRAAVEMQIAEPWYAMALADFKVPYHYERNGHYYYNERPVLELEHKADRIQGMKTAPAVKITGWSPPFQNTLPHRMGHVDAARENHEHHEIKSKRQSYLSAFRYGNESQRLAYWHTAAKTFSKRLEDPQAMLELKLKPGQCVLFNNRRVLHGRRQFNASDGTRHLKGTYIDEQTFQSRLTDMVRRGRVPGQEKSEAEMASRPLGQAPYGPLPPSLEDQVSHDRAQVQAMMEATGRMPSWFGDRAEKGEETEEA